MVKRRPTAKPNVDEKIFKRTAASSKKINLEPSNMRGGIRLWD